jgi:ribosomal protein S9
MNKQTKNILIAVGVIGGGLLLYNIYNNKKKRNKIDIDVKDQISNLQGQLVNANKNLARMEIRSNPELKQTLTNLQRTF